MDQYKLYTFVWKQNNYFPSRLFPIDSQIRAKRSFCSVSLQRCFSLLDRGFIFKLISNYINMITATDSKVRITRIISTE